MTVQLLTGDVVAICTLNVRGLFPQKFLAFTIMLYVPVAVGMPVTTHVR